MFRSFLLIFPYVPDVLFGRHPTLWLRSTPPNSLQATFSYQSHTKSPQLTVKGYHYELCLAAYRVLEDEPEAQSQIQTLGLPGFLMLRLRRPG